MKYTLFLLWIWREDIRKIICFYFSFLIFRTSTKINDSMKSQSQTIFSFCEPAEVESISGFLIEPSNNLIKLFLVHCKYEVLEKSNKILLQLTARSRYTSILINYFNPNPSDVKLSTLLSISFDSQSFYKLKYWTNEKVIPKSIFSVLLFLHTWDFFLRQNIRFGALYVFQWALEIFDKTYIRLRLSLWQSHARILIVF